MVFFDGPEGVIIDQSDNRRNARAVLLNVNKSFATITVPLIFHWPHSLKRFDCVKLFKNDATEVTHVTQYLNHFNFSFPNLNKIDLKTMTRNCSAYKISRQYFMVSTRKESDFPIAFNILFHKNVHQLERLLRTIYREHNHYCIHVDAKTPLYVTEAVRHITDCFDNVFLASRSETVIYQGFSRLVADINCMRDHVERSNSWKYLINMASSELPIMSNLQLVEILRLFNGANNMREVLLPDTGNRYSRRHITHIDAVSKDGYIEHTVTIKDPPPYGLTIIKGNAYNIFSRGFVIFALTDVRAQDLLTWSADTLTPDEHYWATLNNVYINPFLNTPGGNTVHPNKTSYFGRYIGWRDNSVKFSRCLAGRYVHNICIFSALDLPAIKVRHEIIANKFDVDYDPLAYTCMEEWLFNKTRDLEGVPPQYSRLYAKIAKTKRLYNEHL